FHPVFQPKSIFLSSLFALTAFPAGSAVFINPGVLLGNDLTGAHLMKKNDSRTPSDVGLWHTLMFFVTRKLLWRLRKPTYITLLGGPGAGKGTVAVELAPALGLTHLSTGALIRREIAQG